MKLPAIKDGRLGDTVFIDFMMIKQHRPFVCLLLFNPFSLRASQIFRVNRVFFRWHQPAELAGFVFPILISAFCLFASEGFFLPTVPGKSWTNHNKPWNTTFQHVRISSNFGIIVFESKFSQFLGRLSQCWADWMIESPISLVPKERRLWARWARWNDASNGRRPWRYWRSTTSTVEQLRCQQRRGGASGWAYFILWLKPL